MEHETRYDYSAAVSLAQHLAYLRPLQDAHQQLHDHALDIDPPPCHRSESRDAMGNLQQSFSLLQAHRHLRVHSRSRVTLRPRFADLQPQTSPAWDGLAQSLRYRIAQPFEPAVEFLGPSAFVPRLQPLLDYAMPSFAPGAPLAAAALDLMQRLHRDFKYESCSTDIDTPLLQVLAQRRGVCQDFAHLMIGALRMLGLPARYVSGYLLTQPLAGAEPAPAQRTAERADRKTPLDEGGAPAAADAPLVGADASHAWVQLWCPDTVGMPATAGAAWLDLDPTNNLVPATSHVRLAVGRDFGDVTPLRGVIRGGGGEHTLKVGVETRRLQPGSHTQVFSGAGLAA